MANTTNNTIKVPQECSTLKSCVWKVIWMFGNEEEWIKASGEQFGVGNNSEFSWKTAATVAAVEIWALQRFNNIF
uniref:Putative ovule protein n=1 Tax=Solanum chacoense TaxID=4108 RepID=A0A0V0HCM3_SOLCH